MRFDSESEDDATVRGRPMDIARAAAREKFRTEVMEITAEVKQRLNAFRTVARGAEGGTGREINWSANAGKTANMRKTTMECTCVE